MKTTSMTFIALMALVAGPVIAQTNTAPATIAPNNLGHNLTLNIQGITTRTGQVFIALCEEAAFDGQGRCALSKIVPIAQTNAPIVFENVPTGTYGVKLFHDVNGNNRLDSNAMGIPREPFAFSNNARGRFGPAKFKDAAFKIDKNTTISIRLESL